MFLTAENAEFAEVESQFFQMRWYTKRDAQPD